MEPVCHQFEGGTYLKKNIYLGFMCLCLLDDIIFPKFIFESTC